MRKSRVGSPGRKRKTDMQNEKYLMVYHSFLLNMVLAFDRFCRENNLEYFLAGGSALGAVRHQGLIPWDDDIDLGMLRPDFERLEKLLAEKGNRLGEYVYSPVAKQVVPDAPIGHLLYLPGYEEPGRAYDPADAPKLDIHPIDGVPKSGTGKKWQRFFSIVHYMAVYRLPTKNKGKAAHLISKGLVKVTPGFLFDFYAAVSRKLISAWPADRAEYVCSLFGLAGYEKEVMKRELLVPFRKVPFEGNLLPIPGKEKEYLTRLYGDYSVLPPEEDRVPKHDGYKRFMLAIEEK